MTPARLHPQLMPGNPMSLEEAWWDPAACPEPPVLCPVTRGPPQLVRVSDQRALLDGAPLGRLEMQPATEAAFDALCQAERGRPEKVLLSEWSPRPADGEIGLDGWTGSRSVEVSIGARTLLVNYWDCFIGQYKLLFILTGFPASKK